jgi:hypothetical protein
MDKRNKALLHKFVIVNSDMALDSAHPNAIDGIDAPFTHCT